jgi:hypothetical protein
MSEKEKKKLEFYIYNLWNSLHDIPATVEQNKISIKICTNNKKKREIAV